jgi:hypothetical protein
MKYPSVSQASIQLLLDNAETQEHTFWEKEHVISYRLRNGFTVLGRAACVDARNFDLELGRKYARENAVSQLWQLEGYLLQNSIYLDSLENF